VEKSPDAFRTISEAAEELDLPQHVLRFWETRFSTIKPLKRGGGRRYYRPEDVQLLKGIRHLLYDQGFTIKGVQRILKEQGARQVIAIGQGGAPVPVDGVAVDGDASEAQEQIGLPLSLTESERELLGQVLKELLECKRLLDRAREAA
jgi:DNA-binding transcriptional MerR regulator